MLYAGAGADRLNGGSGADSFVFKALSDSTVSRSGRDTIYDYTAQSDRFDLAVIDADISAVGNKAFHFVGTAAFGGKNGELRYIREASDTYIYGDVNGDRKADFAIHLDDAVSLQKGYFVL
ncbi:M10 family metallopeptidase C-terminal domain-containing protein [Sinorhizobium medicae]|uniref:M10 family metallopeptidase C-terminal domain-containing protein n=1 Tax=Sinorhizobium medicae TaxID=110321 RepID=UPI00308D8CDD|nr:M10 family metallopeptidase C-terminal domain-containing protein [Sinorhizobium medicae]